MVVVLGVLGSVLGLDGTDGPWLWMGMGLGLGWGLGMGMGMDTGMGKGKTKRTKHRTSLVRVPCLRRGFREDTIPGIGR